MIRSSMPEYLCMFLSKNWMQNIVDNATVLILQIIMFAKQLNTWSNPTAQLVFMFV